MLAINFWSGTGASTSSFARNRWLRTAPLVVLALAMAACSGASRPTSTPKSEEQRTGTVVVRAITTSGVAIGGVDVSLCGVVCRSTDTDATGEARFADFPVGNDVGTGLSSPGFYSAYESFSVAADSVTTMPVTLVQVGEATPVLLAAHPTYSSDGRTLTLDIDVAVLDVNSAPWQTLSASDFKASGSCDGWYGCSIDIDGTPTPYRFDATVIDASFTPAPNTPRPVIAAAVLLDQSAQMASFDPDSRRLQAVGNFFDSITSPDTAALGSYQCLPGTPNLTTYGAFTSDATVFAVPLTALAGQESGTNPLDVAISEMIAFVAVNAGAIDLRRSVIAVTADSQSADDPDSADCGELGCSQFLPMIVDNARAAGVSVVAMGPENRSTSLIALQTGGAVVRAQDPMQFPVIFSAVNSIIAHDLAFNRVRMFLNADQPGVFSPGSKVAFGLEIRVAAGSYINWDLTVPL
jgi:hypothetical protein